MYHGELGPKDGFTISNNKYLITKASTFASATSAMNYKAAGSLLATGQWSSFANPTYAMDAIGSPTIEMWCESWNTVYNSTDYPNNQVKYSANSNGYLVGGTSSPTSSYFSMSNYEGYKTNKNTLYFPDDCTGYWLSTPAADDNYAVQCVLQNGSIHYKTFYNAETGLRPVVCLNNNVTGTLSNNEWTLSTN